MRRALIAVCLLAVVIPSGIVAPYVSSDARKGFPVVTEELEAQEGSGMAAEWSLQSAILWDSFNETRLSLRVENISDHYIMDGYFYAEVYDWHGRFCYSTLFRLRENREGERGPLRPGGERTLESVEPDLHIASNPRTIRVWPAKRRSTERGEVFTAPVPVRTPVTMLAVGLPVPTPRWAILRLGRLRQQYDGPVIDLALAEVEVGTAPMGKALAMRVLAARSPSVRDWVEHLEPHLLFDPARRDFTPHAAKAFILVRAAALRPWCEKDSDFIPRESEWIKKFVSVSVVGGDNVPPVSTIELSPCSPDTSSAGAAHGRRSSAPGEDCMQYNALGTEWSGNLRSPTHMPKESMPRREQ